MGEAEEGEDELENGMKHVSLAVCFFLQEIVGVEMAPYCALP